MYSKIPSLIPNIVLLGATNVGKSSIINALSNQDVSIVSDIAGTTTDEVVKRMELLDIGPINVIDTAGLDDQSLLKDKRIEKTKKALKRANLVIYIVDSSNINLIDYDKINGTKILVFNKIDLLSLEEYKQLRNKYLDAIFISINIKNTIDILSNEIKKRLEHFEKMLLDNINFVYNKVVHVIPIDSAAPKGRLILPQMQLIRECLDNDIVSIVLKETELENYLEKNNDIDFIVTDSQIFNIVSTINNNRFNLTSYSILQARQKGDLNYFVNSIRAIKDTKINNVLIMESCSHNVSHEDIGQVKIPKMLKEIIANDLKIDFKMSHDFPDDISKYDLIVHCGSCMLNSEIMIKRIKTAKENKILMTNYGLLIAFYFNILESTILMFKDEIKGEK